MAASKSRRKNNRSHLRERRILSRVRLEGRRPRDPRILLELLRQPSTHHTAPKRTVPELGREILHRLTLKQGTMVSTAAPEQEYVAVDVDTEELTWGSTIVEVLKRAKASHPGARLYVARLGHSSALELHSR